MQRSPDPCPACGAPGAPRRWRDSGYDVFRCRDCGLGFVRPLPTAAELAAYYNSGYRVDPEGHRNYDQRRLDGLERRRPQRGRLLEVGASWGDGLALARARGWEVAGLELSDEAAGHARERHGLDVATGDLLEARLEPASFDAVAMWHVLEHTREPLTQLERVAELLRPGGVLALRVPNGDAFGARVAGRWWIWMAVPDHLWYFTAASLERLLRRAGLEPLEWATTRGDGMTPYMHAAFGAAGRTLEAAARLRARVGPPRGGDGAGAAAGAAPEVSTRQSRPVAHRLYEAALAATARLDAVTAGAVRRLEAAGHGDELVVYARRPERATPPGSADAAATAPPARS